MRPVSYIYNEELTKFVYNVEHPMKPIRLKMTNSLIEDYKLTKLLNMVTGRAASKK